MANKKKEAPRIKRILLVRHGYSMGNHDSRYYAELGDSKVPLHDKGWEQAIRAGAFLKDYYARNPSSYEGGLKLWASSYLRTRETLSGIIHGAQGALDHCGEIVESPDLVEQDFGLFSFKTDKKWQEQNLSLEKEFTRARERQHKFFSRLPHGESPFDTYLRMGDVIASMNRDADHKGINDVAVICHGVTLRAFATRFLRISDRAWDHFRNPGNCDVYAIEWDDQQKAYGLHKVFDGEQGIEVRQDILAELRKAVPPLTPKNLAKPPKQFRIR